jgi:hypothetical protein
MAVVERRWWRRRRPMKTAAVVLEVRGVDSDGGDRPKGVASTAVVVTDGVESGWDLESFGMKSEMTWDGLLFIGSKISTVILI